MAPWWPTGARAARSRRASRRRIRPRPPGDSRSPKGEARLWSGVPPKQADVGQKYVNVRNAG
eukprot:4583407-Pyramimonas_sp.AAC.1